MELDKTAEHKIAERLLMTNIIKASPDETYESIEDELVKVQNDPAHVIIIDSMVEYHSLRSREQQERIERLTTRKDELEEWLTDYRDDLKKTNVFHKNTAVINAINSILEESALSGEAMDDELSIYDRMKSDALSEVLNEKQERIQELSGYLKHAVEWIEERHGETHDSKIYKKALNL